MNNYKNGIEKAKNIYRTLHPGGCKILSIGSDGCMCFLCQCDRAVDHQNVESKVNLCFYCSIPTQVTEKGQACPICGGHPV